MQNDKKISLIIPVYNVEKYVQRCVYSIQKEIRNIQFLGEIIIVDDGSTDQSIKKIEEIWDKNLPWPMKIIQQSNQGVGAARNNGLNMAEGEYVAFVDPDDFLLDNYLSTFYKEVLNSNNDITVFSYIQKLPRGEVITKETQMHSLNCFYDISVWNKFYKKKYLSENNITFISSKAAFEDVGFMIQALSQTEKISYINKTLYCYDNSRSDSTMNSLSEKKLFDMIDVLNDAFEKINFNNILPEKREEIEYMVAWHVLARHIPKFIKAYGFNLFEITKYASLYREKVELIINKKGFNNIFGNDIFIEDPNKYFFNKIGKQHSRKIEMFYSGNFFNVLKFLISYIFFKINKKEGNKND